MRVLFSPDPAFEQNNAYFPLLCGALRKLGVDVDGLTPKTAALGPKPDIVHIHFPEFPLVMADLKEAKRRLRNQDIVLKAAELRGAKLIWTAHNLRPHERRHPELEKAFYRKWLPRPDGITVLTETAKQMLLEVYPQLVGRPIAVIPHGHYRDSLKRTHTSATAREAWGLKLDGLVVGAIGSVRPYKNLPLLIRTFKDVARPDEQMLIAGSCRDEELEGEIRSLTEGDDRFRLRFEFLSDADLESATLASSLVVAPYSDITNSGSLFYTLSCDRPFLGPRIGSLPEVERELGAEWVKLYDPPFSAEWLRQEMDAVSKAPMSGSPDLHRYDWKHLAQLTLEFYRQIKGV